MKTLHGGLGWRSLAARLVLCVILVSVASGGLATASQACGIGTHNYIVDMALNAMDKQAYLDLWTLMQAYKGPADTGSVFPDWAYAAQYSGEDDLAHGYPFTGAFLKYLKPKFKSTAEVDRKNLAFFFGILAHNEADNAFHFGEDAFLTLAMSNDGSKASARLVCIAGGFGPDTCIEFAIDIIIYNHYGEYWEPDEWYYPIETIQAVYSQFGKTISAADLENGRSKQDIAHIAEKAYSLTDPFDDLIWTHENLLNYSHGGLQDMANHVALAWQRAWDELNTYRVFVPLLQSAAPGP